MLPGFIPRIFELATSGFSTLAFYMALVYNIVKLLPDDHLYLQNQNIGKYGVKNVITAAAQNLKFTRNNIDQIIIFFTILAAVVIIVLQLLLLVLAFVGSQSAFALSVSFPVSALFTNPNGFTGSLGPEQDLAFIILDRVFGLVGIYDSCISTAGVACQTNAGLDMPETEVAYPYPFHRALHEMLQFYSYGIIIIASLIFVYFIITVVGETAASGTPFGQRFNRAWAPVRFVLFFALIIPINLTGNNPGLNGAQILTFWVAKHGSNFATNAWTYFNLQLSAGTFLGPNSSVIGTPNRPEMGSLNQFMLTAKVCSIIERTKYNNDIQPYIVRPEVPDYVTPTPPSGPAASPNALPMLTTAYTLARDFSLQGNIKVRFGVLGRDTNSDGVVDEFDNFGGNVFPRCGDITLTTTDVFEVGSITIAAKYYEMLQDLWTDTSSLAAPALPMRSNQVAACIVNKQIPGLDYNPNCTPIADDDYVNELKDYYKAFVQDAIDQGIADQIAGGNFLVPVELREKGWAGAAIWYNRVAEMNGAIIGATMNIPRPDRYPYEMEVVLQERVRQNENISGNDRFKGSLADGRAIILDNNREEYYAPMHEAFSFWETRNAADSPQTTQTGNAFIDTINLVLGTSGIFEMRENTDVHPLAQLTSIGKGMMDATIRNTAIAGAGVVGGGLAGIIDPFPEQVIGVATAFMWSVISASIGIAVILYYVLPFLPFIYFLFAVSGWIKSIFEAVVAMPLWALAHIRIDGDGIPGQDAANGYFLLFEIFLRPILILFGLLASISIFGALVFVLNSVFDLLVANVGGFDAELQGEIDLGASTLPSMLSVYRSSIDQFFFTAMYAIICYLLGISCFKLVDAIPNNILRWMNVNAKTFQEDAGDPAGQLTNNVYRGSVLVTNQVKGATQGNLQAIVSG